MPSDCDEWSENEILAWFVRYRRKCWRSIHCTTSANGQFHSKGARAQAYVLGMEPGEPDIAVHEPTALYHGARFELKRFKRPYARRVEQSEIIQMYRERGYYAVYCIGLRALVDAFNQYCTEVYRYRAYSTRKRARSDEV